MHARQSPCLSASILRLRVEDMRQSFWSVYKSVLEYGVAIRLSVPLVFNSLGLIGVRAVRVTCLFQQALTAGRSKAFR